MHIALTFHYTDTEALVGIGLRAIKGMYFTVTVCALKITQ
jgi:hypothetical protein